MNVRLFVLIVLLLLIGIVTMEWYGGSKLLAYEVATHDSFVSCASGLYAGLARADVTFDSQCLGVCGNYSADIVHVPRIAADDLLENQCREYRENITTGFIELDKDGNVVRIEG
ncbi:MAG: hypothetical protein AABX53_01765 [Nanoarchaeota archaeon]